MEHMITNLGYAAIFSILGLLLFTISFIIFDKATPFDLWRELVEKNNIALAIVVGAIALGLCFIISAAMRG
ncbi:MAG: DUF350 domain-containing protein [Deltaproteobacteria bacterium]|nr:DUF350 domain-containing protein [Deltaproteobacteria bacterium]